MAHKTQTTEQHTQQHTQIDQKSPEINPILNLILHAFKKNEGRKETNLSKRTSDNHCVVPHRRTTTRRIQHRHTHRPQRSTHRRTVARRTHEKPNDHEEEAP
ncbi:hypothetical protein V8G54_013929 [Vigna mungo]|uniref:Uncharacterized protein n=1 Tax=Vigna mungo TaxID=3915 RepID=A0AAQ3RVG9_VIGMU